MTIPTEMTSEVFSATASEVAIVCNELRRNIRKIRRVDFVAENHLQDAIESLQQTLCAIWEEFEDDEPTMSHRRENKQL
jgi:hypothetical protein